MNFKIIPKEEWLKYVLKNKRVKKRIEELKLSKEQMIDCLPILMTMDQEKDDAEAKFLTSFSLDKNKIPVIEMVRSTAYSKIKYLDNIKTLKFEQVDFEDDKEFIKEESRTEVIKYIQKTLEGKEKLNFGLYLHGDMGIGKTFILKRIARKFAQNDNSIAFLTLPNFASKIKTLFNNPEGMDELISSCKNVDHLFLDDIGAEQISSWFRDDILFPILNHRMQAKKPTHFSSNYSMDQLIKIESKNQYSEMQKSKRLIERIKATSYELIQKGQNKRHSRKMSF